MSKFSIRYLRITRAKVQVTLANSTSGLLLILCSYGAGVGPCRASGESDLSDFSRQLKFGAIGSFSTNYFYRGYTKSDNHPTLRANVDMEHTAGFFAGGWISWVDFSDRHLPGHSDVEFYPYIGYTIDWTKDFRSEVQVARYIYNDKVFGQYSDYNDYSVALHYRDMMSFRVYFADNAYHRGKPFTTFELTGRYPILEQLEFSAGAGYNDAASVVEYDSAYWHAGLVYYWHWLSLDFRYVDSHFFGSSVNEVEALANDEIVLLGPDPKFVFSLNIGF